MRSSGRLSIWFFIGVLLSLYGVLITGTGLFEFVFPPVHRPVLAELHAALWWGIVLLVIGLIYLIRFYPRKFNG